MADLNKEEFSILGLDIDIDEVYVINNKTITPPENTEDYKDIVVVGDDNSNSLVFKINKVIDSVDLSDKIFQFFYVNPDDYSDIVNAREVRVASDYILFTWKLDSNVTHTAGKVKFIVRISGSDYVWKSKPSTFEVVDTLDELENPPEYTDNWIRDVETRLGRLETLSGVNEEGTDVIQNDISQLKKVTDDLKAEDTNITTSITDIHNTLETVETNINTLKAESVKVYSSVEEAESDDTLPVGSLVVII